MRAYQLLQLASITMALCNIWMLLEDKSNIIFTIAVITTGVIMGIIYVHKDLQVRKLKYKVWMLQQNHMLAERTIEILEKEKKYLQTMLSTFKGNIDEYSVTKNLSNVFSNMEQMRYKSFNSADPSDCSRADATSHNEQARNENFDTDDGLEYLTLEETSNNRQERDDNSDSLDASECLVPEATSDNRKAKDSDTDSVVSPEYLDSESVADNRQERDGKSDSVDTPAYLDFETTSDNRLAGDRDPNSADSSECLVSEETWENRQARDGNSDSADVLECLDPKATSYDRQTKERENGNSTSAEASECVDSEATLDNMLHSSKYSEIRRALKNAEKATERVIKENHTSAPEISRKTNTSCGNSGSNTKNSQNQHVIYKPELHKRISVEEIIKSAIGISKESTRSCECSCCSQSRSQTTRDQTEQCQSNLEKLSKKQNSSTTRPAPVMSGLTSTSIRDVVTDNIKTKKSRSTYGNTSHNVQDLVQTMCSEFLDDLERQIGRDHPDFASMLENLAKLHQDTGRFAEAEKFLTEALTIRETISGKNTREFLAALITLGTMYYTQKRQEESASLFKLALEIRENIFGGDHIDLAKPLRQYALLCQKLNRLEESERCLRKALRIYQSALGPNCKNAVKIRSDLIACLKKMKNIDSTKHQ